MYIEEIPKKYNLLKVFIACIISSICITIIHNIKGNMYIKDFIIPIAIMIINYLILITKLNMKTNKKAYILLIPIFLILVSRVVLEIDFTNMFLNVLIVPVLVSAFFLSLTNPNYTISKDIFSWFFKLFPQKLLANLTYIPRPKEKNNPKKNKVYNILLGIILGIPIAIILLSLLASADKYFSVLIDEILNIIDQFFNFNTIINNIIIILIWFTILFSVFVNILLNKDKKKEPEKIYNINHSTSITILVIINLVFVLFLISEISKLTTNFLQLPIEYTYASYAREGFFQLLLVTTINFSIILYFLYYTKVLKENKTIKNLILILIAFSFILIFNSYYRMILYISNYGFTILRLQVILFLAMEIILFGILIKKIIKKLKYKDSYIFTTVFLITYILNLYLCTEPFIKLLNR